MKTIETVVYNFNELDEKAKLKAIEKHRYFFVEDNWWQDTYNSAEEIGLKITEFELDRGRHINGKFIKDVESVADYILNEFGNDTEMYEIAVNYTTQRTNILEKADKDEYGDFTDLYTLDNELDALDNHFKNELLNDYLNCLRVEYDYLMSDEYITDFLINNEYDFLQDGTRF